LVGTGLANGEVATNPLVFVSRTACRAARAPPATQAEGPPAIEYSEHERAKVRAALARLGPSADHELLLLVNL
jgi:hypothetical protein